VIFPLQEKSILSIEKIKKIEMKNDIKSLGTVGIFDVK
jgi:hypothetical protein